MTWTQPLRRRRAGRDLAGRKREVERCLAQHGLLRRPRELPAGREDGAGEEGFGRRLRIALDSLGPVFSCFAVYLGSRVDLLPAGDCLELAAAPERVAAVPIDLVRRRIAAELGRPAEGVFATLETEPYEAHLLVQTHRARLRDGTPVLVRLADVDAEEALAAELPALPVVAEAFAAGGFGAIALPAVIDDFSQAVRARTDFEFELKALDLLAGDAAAFGLLALPAGCRELATARLLTTTDPGGAYLAEVGRSGSFPPGMRGRQELARRLCAVWLHQALLGRVFPAELRETGVQLLPSGQLSFLAGPFTRLAAAAQSNLRDFLVAVASGEPDDACAYLLRETARQDEAASEAQLGSRLRQIVPFRDGAWSASGESLAEHLFVYVRQARECGYWPRPHLVAFLRGLCAAASVARRLSPEGDALREGLQEVRLLAGMTQVRQAIDPAHWGSHLDRYAAAFVEMPQRLNELLMLADEGRARVRSERLDEALPRRSQGMRSAALLMLMAVVVLVMHRLAGSGLSGAWPEAIAGLVFLVLGGLLLRGAAGRGRG
ncbi:MAG TPA: AarF/UbiB family protein [Thermoanaerobaculia bacterium]|nr:AarF/UbiB family protein [Thermoanaerobaculia bacterium]